MLFLRRGAALQVRTDEYSENSQASGGNRVPSGVAGGWLEEPFQRLGLQETLNGHSRQLVFQKQSVNARGHWVSDDRCAIPIDAIRSMVA